MNGDTPGIKKRFQAFVFLIWIFSKEPYIHPAVVNDDDGNHVKRAPIFDRTFEGNEDSLVNLRRLHVEADSTLMKLESCWSC